MNDCITQYKKELKKNLCCSGNVKGRLLNKFNSSLTTFLEETPTPSMEDMCAAFGSPKEMASVLMEEITPKEAAQHRRNIIITRVAIGFLAIALMVGTVYVYFFKEIPVEEIDAEIVVDEVNKSEDDIIIEDEIIIED